MRLGQTIGSGIGILDDVARTRLTGHGWDHKNSQDNGNRNGKNVHVLLLSVECLLARIWPSGQAVRPCYTPNNIGAYRLHMQRTGANIFINDRLIYQY